MSQCKRLPSQSSEAKIDVPSLATRNRAAIDLEAKARQLLLGLQVLLKEYYPAALRIGVLARDCNRATRDPGSGKNALAVLESRLLGMLAVVGTKWKNVEYIKTLMCALLTWQRWHSRTPGCIHSKEYGEAMLTRL